MRTMNESEWVPAAGESEFPPHVGSGSFEPEVAPAWHLPALVDENGDPTGEPGYVPESEDVENAVTPEPETTPEPEVTAEPADGDTAGEAAPPQADPEPEAPPAE